MAYSASLSPDDEGALDAISERIFDLFVINTESIGYQMPDGTYRRRIVPVSPALIKAMLEAAGSMGCYQQQPRTGNVRWICLDYDCEDKANPDIIGLYRGAILPLVTILDNLGIRHLLEFSGRRGIHVWVVFNRVISKDLGFRIVSAIERQFISRHGELRGRWKLDKFPATDSSKGNVVGMQVKFPLSCHRAGGRSFFFCGEAELAKSIEHDAGESEGFFPHQLSVLTKYRENDPDLVSKALDIEKNPYGGPTKKSVVAKRYRTVLSSKLRSVELSADQLEAILSEIAPYGLIFDRLRRGIADARDRTVIYGTLADFDDGPEFLREVLEKYPCFDRRKTDKAISRLKDRYHSATIGYLCDIYELPRESGVDSGETGFSYLLKRLGMESLLREEKLQLAKRRPFDADVESIVDTIRREKEYLSINDEVRDACIGRDLEDLNQYECQRLAAEMKSIMEGGPSDDSPRPMNYRVYHRIEKSGKVRELVSLSACDRLLTTHLAMRLCAVNRVCWKSYSYHVALMSRSSIFYSWYSSWRRYLWQVRCFIDVDFFDDYEIFFIDLDACYDHIDFLNVYRLISDSLDDEGRNIFQYLVSFNERLMGEMHHDRRMGVPQGPAYARIIAEVYLDRVLESVLEEVRRDDVRCYRYVDDMLFICRPGFDAEGLYKQIVTSLGAYGLPVNRLKSRYYGAIGHLTRLERDELTRKNSLNYELHEGSGDYALLESERRAKLVAYLEAHGEAFDIDLLGYYFGCDVIPAARERFFGRHHTEIVRCAQGRGTSFSRFYRYAFQKSERIEKIITTDVLSGMRVGTVNFSNFVNELYLAHRDGNSAVMNVMGVIVDRLLDDVDERLLDDHDRMLVRVLRRLGHAEKGEVDGGE